MSKSVYKILASKCASLRFIRRGMTEGRENSDTYQPEKLSECA